jgi:transposase
VATEPCGRLRIGCSRVSCYARSVPKLPPVDPNSRLGRFCRARIYKEGINRAIKFYRNQLGGIRYFQGMDRCRGGARKCRDRALAALADRLQPFAIAVMRVNAKRVRDFARAHGLLAKTDRLDAFALRLCGERMRSVNNWPISWRGSNS